VDEDVAVPFTGLPTGVTAGSLRDTFDLTQLATYNATFVTDGVSEHFV